MRESHMIRTLDTLAARCPRARRDARGMTLIELLVAMSISLIITVMIIWSWSALQKSYASTVNRGKAIDMGRFANDRMMREIRDVEQPPFNISEVGVVRARPYYVVVYTTFNKAGNNSAAVPPRLVMYRLYGNGELWRFYDKSDPLDQVISGVDTTLESWPGITFPLSERNNGEGAQLMAKNLVNFDKPSVTSPTPLFTYIYYDADGTLERANDVRGTDNRGEIRAVEMNLLLDLNPGRSPVYSHLRTTAQLRNTR